MSPIRTTIKEAAWILLIALVLAAGAYTLRPVIKETGLQESPGDASEGAVDSATAIDLDSAVGHFNAGTAIFADARSETAYRSGHIEGAMHLDPREFDQWSEQVISRIDADALIIAYCDGERCTLSMELAEKLTWLGYEHVKHLEDGWSRWVAAQMPIRSGSSP